jgi:hypothetical protein
MGNQESVSANTHIIRKKKVKNEPNNRKAIPRVDNVNNSVERQYDMNVHTNRNVNIDRNVNINRNFYTDQNINTYRNVNYEQNNYNRDSDIKSKIVEKEYSNNALLSRSVLNDVYLKKENNIISYPSNSNNELDIPKKNFDNIKFTPYNFTEEVDKFKKDIEEERIEFDNNEKQRRKLFEHNQKDKKKYLQTQIKNFEELYNPWEILGLSYNDLNINNIKKSYKKMALKYHPDRAGNKYQEKFQLITQSYIYLLTKAEENDELNIKINRSVENTDYEDDINEKVENIYIDKDKFDINQFNKIFDKYKIPNSFDKGYSDLMNKDIEKNESDDFVFGKKFNNDIFNAHFDSAKSNKKKNLDIITYQDPEALETSLSNLNQTFLGMDTIEDFGAVNNNGLSYTDYKKAHVDETLLIDVNKVKYKTYNSIDHLESDRSNISYELSPEDKKRQDFLERKRMEEDNMRSLQQRNYDAMIQNQYQKLNQRLIIHK